MLQVVVLAGTVLLAIACAGSPSLPTTTDSLTTPAPSDSSSSTTSAPTTSAPDGDPFLVVTGAMIDGTGADRIPDAVVVIQGDTIVAAGARGDVSIPLGAEVIDLPNATILPGFINTHVHNAYDVSNLTQWAQAGVTTVRDLGARWDGTDYFFLARYFTNEVNRAARVIPAGPLVTVPDGYPIAGNRFPSLAVTSPDDARRRIDRLIDDGAQVIKITLTVGGPPTLSLAEATAIVETAHRRGIPVSAHVTDTASLIRALDAGVDDIAHSVIDRVSDTQITRMIDGNVSWIPTQAIQERMGAGNLRRFADAGGRVALGNDAGFLAGVLVGMPIHEIEAMASAGFTPMEIILASTRDAAYVCRLDHLLGTIEAGKLADLLVVRGDPLEDLSALEDVVMVVHGGEIIRFEE